MLNDLAAIQRAIRRLHGCQAEHRESVPLTKTFLGSTVSLGVVEVFDLIGHATAAQCYVWPNAAIDGAPRHWVILAQPPVDAPIEAIRAALRAESKQRPLPVLSPQSIRRYPARVSPN